MNKIILIIILCSFCHLTNAQLLVLRDVNGIPIPINQYTNVTGSPFLYDDWVKGSVNFANGSSTIDVDLKYDQVADKIYFKNEEGIILVFSDPIKQFILTDINNQQAVRTFINGIYISPEKGGSGFYEILVDEELKLLRKTKKTINESKEYGSATINKTISKSDNYYLLKGKDLINIKKDKKFISENFPDKAKELEAFVKKNKLNLKEELDLIQLVSFYNSFK